MLTFIRETLQPKALDEIEDRYGNQGLELTATRITVKGPTKHIILASIYRPPGTPMAWFDTLEALVLELAAMGPLGILGDLNADLLKPRSGAAKYLKKALALGEMKVSNITPTRICATAATCLQWYSRRQNSRINCEDKPPGGPGRG